MIKENYMYVGIDLHKETHTAVIIDCYNQKLGEITFPNRPADFPKLVAKVKKCNTAGKEVVYGLENAYGYGRALAVWLIDKGYFVKDVNTAISHRQAKHRGAMYRKAGFKDDVNYDPKKGFSISQNFMRDNGLDHNIMTSKQRELFKELYESGRPNTLEEHTRIAREALKAGGASDSMIDDLINASLRNLREQGVTAPTRIPWYSK